MKKTIITTICLLFVVLGYTQVNDERYEHCAFRVYKGFSEGASTTDFVFSKQDMTQGMEEASREMLFTKDLVFDVQFLYTEDGTIMRVYHLNEVTLDDLKAMFSQIAGNIDYVISPSRVHKFDATGKD
ncbi:MAG: hypothetical protein DCO96_03210 [Fluviicola sp. XM-24bin1]|nr:MAG: hypothetical protein DCO96_03210 [Fluviicola sp. XM-24bin1]